MIIVGTSGSGKTFSLCKIIPMLFFEKLYFIVKNPQQNIYNTIKNSIESAAKKSGKQVEVKSSNSLDDITKIYQNQHTAKSQTGKFPPVLVVIDDFSHTEELKNPQVIQLFQTGRPFNISTILITQNLFNAPPPIRRNITDLILFKIPGGASELYKAIFKPFIDSFSEFKLILKNATEDPKDPYSFLYLNYEIGTLPKKFHIRKGFKQIIEKETDSNDI